MDTLLPKKINLNTTNVSVQFAFAFTLKEPPKVFKYNKCIGSIKGAKIYVADGLDLNTTNVSVQSYFSLGSSSCISYLNTTNVSVQCAESVRAKLRVSYLNTTNVSVQ